MHYTANDVAGHSTSSDCWLILYLSRHPGGSNIIASKCGTDATSSYSRFHSQSKVANGGTSYIKGRLGSVSGVQAAPCDWSAGSGGGSSGGTGGDYDSDDDDDDDDHDDGDDDDGDDDGDDDDGDD